MQRYEREMSLPVHRPAGKSAGSVMATKAELDGWVAARPIREAFRLLETSVDTAAPLREFRQHVNELRRLREEAAPLRAAIRTSLGLLQTNLFLALPAQDLTREDPSGPRLTADGPADHPRKEVV